MYRFGPVSNQEVDMETEETARDADSLRPLSNGLEGVIVAETKLSHVDGARGQLILAGHEVEALAGRTSFAEVCGLFAAASRMELPAPLHSALGEARVRAFARLSGLGDALSQAHCMDSLRAAMSHLSESSGPVDVIGAVGVFAAAWARTRAGLPVIAPSLTRGHAEDLLAMFGLEHDAARAHALDAYLVTVCDHGLNASTFTARVIASTESDLVSAVVGAIGALKGPLHGGAPGPVLDLLDQIGDADRASAVLTAELDRGRRIMGMGHRIYRVRDPRAFVLERAIETLETALDVGAIKGESAARKRLKLARAVEREAERLLAHKHPNRALRANVEFYTAVLLEALGIPRESFSAVFAAGRVLGWTAHVAEQRSVGKLIRPSSRYVGRLPD